MGHIQLATASRTSTGILVSGACEVETLSLLAGADAATAIFRDGGPLGPIVAVLGAATGLSAPPYVAPSRIRILTTLHVTVTGTTPIVVAGIPTPTPNQNTPAVT